QLEAQVWGACSPVWTGIELKWYFAGPDRQPPLVRAAMIIGFGGHVQEQRIGHAYVFCGMINACGDAHQPTVLLCQKNLVDQAERWRALAGIIQHPADRPEADKQTVIRGLMHDPAFDPAGPDRDLIDEDDWLPGKIPFRAHHLGECAAF